MHYLLALFSLLSLLLPISSKQCLPTQIPCGETCCSNRDTCCQSSKDNITGCAPPNTTCCPYSPKSYCFTHNETCCPGWIYHKTGACAPKTGTCCDYSPLGYCTSTQKCCATGSEDLNMAACIDQNEECCIRYGGNPISAWSCPKGKSCCKETGAKKGKNSSTCYDKKNETCCPRIFDFWRDNYNKVCPGLNRCCLDDIHSAVCFGNKEKCCNVAEKTFICDNNATCCSSKNEKAPTQCCSSGSSCCISMDEDGSQCCPSGTFCCPSLGGGSMLSPVSRYNMMRSGVDNLCADPEKEFCCSFYDYYYIKRATTCPLGKLCCPGSKNSMGGCCWANATSYKCQGYSCPVTQ